MNRLARKSGVFMLFFFLDVDLMPMDASANEANTLIAVHIVELTNKNNPVNRTYSDRYNSYRLINEETKNKKVINQNGRAKFLYLEPGSYCFYSTNFGQFEIMKISNSVCFRVAESGLTNAGTWVIGIKASPPDMYAILIDMKENYSELESILEVNDSTPAVMNMPAAK